MTFAVVSIETEAGERVELALPLDVPSRLLALKIDRAILERSCGPAKPSLCSSRPTAAISPYRLPPRSGSLASRTARACASNARRVAWWRAPPRACLPANSSRRADSAGSQQHHHRPQRSQVPGSTGPGSQPPGPGQGRAQRQHASIGRDGSSHYLLDMESTNGTRVNGEKAAPGKKLPLKDGDVIQFGPRGPADLCSGCAPRVRFEKGRLETRTLPGSEGPHQPEHEDGRGTSGHGATSSEHEKNPWPASAGFGTIAPQFVCHGAHALRSVHARHGPAPIVPRGTARRSPSASRTRRTRSTSRSGGRLTFQRHPASHSRNPAAGRAPRLPGHRRARSDTLRGPRKPWPGRQGSPDRWGIRSSVRDWLELLRSLRARAGTGERPTAARLTLGSRRAFTAHCQRRFRAAYSVTLKTSTASLLPLKSTGPSASTRTSAVSPSRVLRSIEHRAARLFGVRLDARRQVDRVAHARVRGPLLGARVAGDQRAGGDADADRHARLLPLLLLDVEDLQVLDHFPRPRTACNL